MRTRISPPRAASALPFLRGRRAGTARAFGAAGSISARRPRATIRPPFTISTCVMAGGTSSRREVMRTTRVAPAAKSPITRRRLAREALSSPPNGSSRINIAGRCIRARAINTLCNSPLLRWTILRSSRWLMPISRTTRGRRRSSPAAVGLLTPAPRGDHGSTRSSTSTAATVGASSPSKLCHLDW